MNNNYLFSTRYLVGLLIVGLLTKCSIKETESFNYSRSISIAKSNFTDSLTSHFPYTNDGAYRLITIAPKLCVVNGRCGIALIAQLNDSSIHNLQEIMKDKGLNRTFFYDECNLVVNAVETGYDCNEFLDSLLANCSTLKSPLPNFPQILNNSKLLIPQDSIKIERYIIYIIDSEPGKFIDEEYLTIGCGLPPEWTNGYSRGFAINEPDKKVIYWLELW